MSKNNFRLYFCAEAAEREIRRDTYWLSKPVCEKFEDMREKTSMVIIPAIALNRRPLLRNRLYV